MTSFVVERRRSKLSQAPKITAPREHKPKTPGPLTLSDVIERVARIKDMAIRLQGVGRTNGADTFAEAKSELHRAACRLEDDLRTRGVADA